MASTGKCNLINEQLNSLAVVSVTGIDAMADVIVGDIGGVYDEAITDGHYNRDNRNDLFSQCQPRRRSAAVQPAGDKERDCGS